jgi:hypothetical protein
MKRIVRRELLSGDEFRVLQAALGAKTDGANVAASMASDAAIEMLEPPGQAVAALHGPELPESPAFSHGSDGLPVVESMGIGLGALAMACQLAAAGLPQQDDSFRVELIPLEELRQSALFTPPEEDAVGLVRILSSLLKQQLQDGVAGRAGLPRFKVVQIIPGEEPGKQKAVEAFIGENPVGAAFLQELLDFRVHES